MATDEQLPDQYDISLTQGDDYLFDVEVTVDGSTVDFTGHSDGLLQVRRRPGGELITEYTSSGSLTMGAGGRVTVDIPASETQAWPEVVRYEFQSADPDGDIRTYIEGTITTEPEVAE